MEIDQARGRQVRDVDADAGVIQARRILDRLYKEEQAAAAKMAAAE
jgi:hypothetical protein